MGHPTLAGRRRQQQQPLLEFLADWHAKSKPIPEADLQAKPAFERALYELYREYFRPDERFYKDTEYAVIQNEVELYILDSDLGVLFEPAAWDLERVVSVLPRISHFTVKDFRPQLEVPGKKVLFLEPDRLDMMVRFLIDSPYSGHAPRKRYLDEDCDRKKRKKRLHYLNSAMEIFPGHWGTGWHFETHPYINSLYFSKDLNVVLILYRVYYGGGEVVLKCTKDGVWETVLHGSAWVE